MNFEAINHEKFEIFSNFGFCKKAKLSEAKALICYCFDSSVESSSLLCKMHCPKTQHEVLCKRKRIFCPFTAVSSRKQRQIVPIQYTSHTYFSHSHSTQTKKSLMIEEKEKKTHIVYQMFSI